MKRALTLSLMMLAVPAAAHIVIADNSGAAGAYHVAAFRVSHGCGDSPTVSIRIEVPASITTARPQPKPGWILRVERAPLPRPIRTESGVDQAERIAAVTWMGRLDRDSFDEFALLVKLPDSPGPLYFPTLQRCEMGETAWTQVPAKGQVRGDLKSPAPVLTVAGPAPAGMHAH
jgi:uncharacterized protein YcnI